jgi:hypothetical protein
VAVISGLEFRNAPFVYWGAETRVERGTVFCEECLFEAPPSYGNGALMVVNATAVLRRCILVGNAVGTGRAGTYNAGLLVQNAQAFASDCWLRGSDTTFDSYGAGGEGARLSASLAHFVRCVIEGGTQRGCLANPPGAGIRTTGATTLWLADCVVQGGTAACGAGATGLQHGGTTAAQLARCTIAGGPGSVSNGVAITGPTANAPLLGLGADTEPLVRGAAFTVAYRTQPNWPIAVFAATELAVRSEPLLAEPAHLAGTPCLLAIVVADAAGDAIFQTIVPLLPAAPHARFFVEGVAGLAPPFETAPPLGGVLH